MLDCLSCGYDTYLDDAPVKSPEYSEISTRAPKFQGHNDFDSNASTVRAGTTTTTTMMEATSSDQDRESLRQLRQNEVIMKELRAERNQLMGELKQAKREIKMLRTEQSMNRREIDKLRQERQAVKNALETNAGESRDALDSLFDW